MADKIKRENDPALTQQEAQRGAEVTPADVRRAIAKWVQRMPNFRERIKAAKGKPRAAE